MNESKATSCVQGTEMHTCSLLINKSADLIQDIRYLGSVGKHPLNDTFVCHRPEHVGPFLGIDAVAIACLIEIGGDKPIARPVAVIPEPIDPVLQEEWHTKYLSMVLDPVDDETYYHPWLLFHVIKGNLIPSSPLARRWRLYYDLRSQPTLDPRCQTYPPPPTEFPKPTISMPLSLRGNYV
ncbi:Uncharacterized protein TCAP_06779 [Tolypocladium capitatum]|uniref:Uncharacterized protein n=1 Tax=Tolypocladium capitatum TaxID=45235 RepID=A0A2K3Q6S7_9HYPO|nr:Uncharacterized protein TCAP_06779 [Tolypocladium capitatum]